MEEAAASGGNAGLNRTDSQLSEVSRPMSDEEYRELEARLAQDGHNASILGGSLQQSLIPQVENSQQQSIIQHVASQQQQEQQQQLLWAAGNGGDGPGGVADADQQQQIILRQDTLDANPVFVNPADVNNMVQQQQPQVDANATANGQQVQEDSFTIPLYQTPSGTNFFRSASGNAIRVIDSGDIKAEPSSTPLPPPAATATPQPMQVQQQSNNYGALDDAWTNLIEANNDYNFQHQMASGGGGAKPFISGGSTGRHPATKAWPGDYEFAVTFKRLTENAKSKNWDYSNILNKLYIDINSNVLVHFNFGQNYPEGLFIRVLPIFAVADSMEKPVIRCPHHANENDATNKDLSEMDRFRMRLHLIRVGHGDAQYVEDTDSERLSVIFPVDSPSPGTNEVPVPIKFMCLGSDVGGINRRPVKVIFTLESGDGQVHGRQTVEVRICSCPKRDMAQEEKKHRNSEKEARKLAEGLGKRNSSLVILNSTNSMTSSSSSKKRKVDNVEEMVMVPVSRLDFEKLNEMSEALMIARNIDKVSEIKAARRRLLEANNLPGAFKKVKKENK